MLNGIQFTHLQRDIHIRNPVRELFFQHTFIHIITPNCIKTKLGYRPGMVGELTRIMFHLKNYVRCTISTGEVPSSPTFFRIHLVVAM